MLGLFMISKHGTLSCSPLLFEQFFVSCLLREHVWQPQVTVDKTHWSITCF